MIQASKDLYLQCEEAVKGREVVEANGYLLIACTSRMMLTLNEGFISPKRQKRQGLPQSKFGYASS